MSKESRPQPFWLGFAAGLEVTRGEVRPLVGHTILIRGCGRRGEFQTVRANRVIGDAELSGFACIQRSDYDGWLAEKVHGPDIRLRTDDVEQIER